MEKQVKEERRGRKETNKMIEEEMKRTAKAKQRLSTMKEEMNEIKEGVLPPQASSVITQLYETSVRVTPNTDDISGEGNTISHYGPNSNRNCFIGSVMTSVCYLFHSVIY